MFTGLLFLFLTVKQGFREFETDPMKQLFNLKLGIREFNETAYEILRAENF